MTAPVALTGATGFLGGTLIRALALRGTPARVLLRRPLPGGAFGPGVEAVDGDLDDEAALGRLVKGARAVIHCAGVVRGSSYRAFERVNVSGTAHLVRAAARQAPQPRFLLLSSVAAREPRLSWYARSKRESEQVLEREAQGMPWTVFRATAVHGPGEREMQRLFDAMKRGLLPVVGAPSGRISLLHVDDLVRALLSWTDASEPVGGVFELQDGSPGGYGWGEIARIAEQALGRSVRRIPVPAALLFGVAWLNLARARLMGPEPMLTPGKVRELRHPDWVCDNEPLARALGWRPCLSLADALSGQ